MIILEKYIDIYTAIYLNLLAFWQYLSIQGDEPTIYKTKAYFVCNFFFFYSDFFNLKFDLCNADLVSLCKYAL